MRLGILGGGQLARMMALEAHWMGIETSVLDPNADSCAGLVAKHVCAEYEDRDQVQEFARQCDVVTCDFENISNSSVSWVEQTRTPFHPRGIQYFQNRYLEKGFLHQRGFPVVEFQPVYSLGSLKRLVEKMPPPLILKKQSMGYDGKGQFFLEYAKQTDLAWKKLNDHPPFDALVAERYIRFDRELSLVAARSRGGQLISYPISENYHHRGVLKCTLIQPQPIKLTLKATEWAYKLMKDLDYVGVMVLEFFQCGNELMINEIAPRPHNSGHWSVNGAICSQFSNHVRGVMEMPLGAAIAHFPCCAMLNLLGADVADNQRHDEAIFQLCFMLPNFACLHNYRKSHRPGRKLGHIFIYASRSDLLIKRVRDVREIVTGSTDLYDMEFDLPEEPAI